MPDMQAIKFPAYLIVFPFSNHANLAHAIHSHKKRIWEQKYLEKIQLCRYVSSNCFTRVVTVSCYMSPVTCVSQ